jgi:hypothetical protein
VDSSEWEMIYMYMVMKWVMTKVDEHNLEMATNEDDVMLLLLLSHLLQQHQSFLMLTTVMKMLVRQ